MQNNSWPLANFQPFLWNRQSKFQRGAFTMYTWPIKFMKKWKMPDRFKFLILHSVLYIYWVPWSSQLFVDNVYTILSNWYCPLFTCSLQHAALTNTQFVINMLLCGWVWSSSKFPWEVSAPSLNPPTLNLWPTLSVYSIASFWYQNWTSLAPFLPRMRMHKLGLSKWFCPSVRHRLSGVCPASVQWKLTV